MANHQTPFVVVVVVVVVVVFGVVAEVAAASENHFHWLDSSLLAMVIWNDHVPETPLAPLAVSWQKCVEAGALLGVWQLGLHCA